MTTSFEELLNSSQLLKRGDKVTGVISKISDNKAYVDVAFSQYDCIITKDQARREYTENIEDVFKVGDEVEAIVIKIVADREKKKEDVPGAIFLSVKAIENIEYKKALDLSWEELLECYKKGEYVTAKITSVTKGGLLADVRGVRAFVPVSFVDIKFNKNLKQFVDREYTFKIEELNKENNRLILNRRIILEEEKTKKLDDIYSKIKVGDVIEGEVNRIVNFGAFVNLGEVDGLVHLSEISHKRFKEVEEVLHIGEVVKVEVIGVDREAERVSLSIKKLLPTPWQIAKGEIQKGDELDGVVKNITTFGAFVELLPEVEGLVHISQISHDRVEKVEDVLKSSDKVRVKVLDIDFDNEKISLSIKDLLEKPVKVVEEKEAEFDTSYLKDEDTAFSVADKFKDLSL